MLCVYVQLVGFVEFDRVEDAVRSRDSMQGASPFAGVAWHIHFSNNTKGAGPKKPREDFKREPTVRNDVPRPGPTLSV